MRIIMRTLAFTGILSLLLVAGLFATNKSNARQRESANGHGTLISQDENGRNVRRQFSFSAHRRPDGSVQGNAVLHNPAFRVDNGQKYQLQIDIVCLRVIGNTAILSGFTRRTNDPNLVDVASFIVRDNGEPGKDRDLISGVHFFDDDPATTGDPQVCQNTGPTDYPLAPIENGNIQVRGGTAP